MYNTLKKEFSEDPIEVIKAITFLGTANGYKINYEHVHESPINMKLPLILLSLGSIFIGYFFKDMMVGLGTDF